ncbi:hypothetical protein D3C87_1951610 [compost metagenome]
MSEAIAQALRCLLQRFRMVRLIAGMSIAISLFFGPAVSSFLFEAPILHCVHSKNFYGARHVADLVVSVRERYRNSEVAIGQPAHR